MKITSVTLLWRKALNRVLQGARFQRNGALQRGFMPFMAFLLLFAGCRPASDIAEHVELSSNFADLGPAATFELRFDQPMMRSDRVGISDRNFPLVIAPSLPGEFTWLGQRSGVFTPSKALDMDTRYEFALASGLRNIRGQPVQAKLRKTLQTPSFSLTRFLPSCGSSNASAKPKVMLFFNVPIQARVAGHFMEFRDSQGCRVPADVRQGTLEEQPPAYELGGTGTLQTWNEQFTDRRSVNKHKSPALEDSSLETTNTVSNFLVVCPRHPLQIGKGWKLLIDAGLPASEGGLRSRARQEVVIGDVTAFTFNRGTAHNVINHSPTIELEFSKPLAPAVTNHLFPCLDIVPCPEDITAELRGRALILKGSFQSDTHYTVTLRADLSASEPFTLGETQILNVLIPRVEPRLYFPAFSNDQLADGRRNFELLAINVPKLRLRAKLLEPRNAIHALRGYDG